MATFTDPLEKYWSDEEAQLRKRGIDPMTVPQVTPPKLPTHPGNVTLHKRGGMVGGPKPTRHVNKSYRLMKGS
jgi:hypothetical protein